MKIDAGDKSGECGDRFHACTVYCVVVNGGRDGLYPTTLKSRHEAVREDLISYAATSEMLGN